MPLIGTREDALATRRAAPGYPTFRSDFLSEDAPRGTRRGNAKLVEQEPFSTLGAHFHYVNQFQIVVSGSGKIGRHDVRPVTVQFAGAHTSYGPLQAGADGLGYLVLRDAINPGLHYMPGEVAMMDRSIPRRYFMGGYSTGGPADRCSIAGHPATDGVSETIIQEQQQDGLAASVYRLLPGGRYHGRKPDTGGGQFHVVMSGTVECGAAEYAPLCCIFSSADEESLTLRAGPEGAEIVFLQFPSKAEGVLV